MTDEQGTPDDVLAVQRIMAVAHVMITALLDARRRNDANSGAAVGEALFNAQDAGLTMMVLGQLASTVVFLEERLSKAHGPLLDRDTVQFDCDTTTPAMTAASDQMNAAAKDGDYTSFAKAAVDGQVDALRCDMENPKYDVNLEHVLPAMQLLDQHSVCLVAAEALLRLAR